MSESERSEYIGFYVTPEFKLELDKVKDRAKLKDEMIKRYFQDEKDWIKKEIKEMTETDIRYRGVLLSIKDNFQEAQEAYQEEIESIYTKASQTFSKITQAVDDLKKKTSDTKDDLYQITQGIKYIHTDQIEKLVSIAERFGKLNADEKELIKSIINKQ